MLKSLLQISNLIFQIKLGVIVIFLSSCSESPQYQYLTPSFKSETIERGSQLVNGLAACGYCHSPQAKPSLSLSGGQSYHDIFGEVLVPNITAISGGVGDWSTDQLIDAIRLSKRPEGNFTSFEAHEGYLWMSDDDAYAIASYIAAQPAVGSQYKTRDISRREIGIFENYSKGFLVTEPHDVGYVPNISSKNKVEYGEYLADNVAQCFLCHNSPRAYFSEEKYLGGGKEVKKGEITKNVPNIRQLFSTWSQEEIYKYLKKGEDPNSTLLEDRLCPLDFYKQVPDSELLALVSYFKSLP
jgi:cytochrome c553